MRVIRHESGWDIALDMVFTHKETAEIIATRIQNAVHALVRDSVDESMCGHNDAENIGRSFGKSTVARKPVGYVAKLLRQNAADYDSHPAFASCPYSPFACLPGCFVEEAFGYGTTRWRFPITANVPILWAHNATLRNMLFGMRQVPQTSLDFGTHNAGGRHEHRSSNTSDCNRKRHYAGEEKYRLTLHIEPERCRTSSVVDLMATPQDEPPTLPPLGV